MSIEKGKMLNIPRSVTDEFYRYKMPDLVHKIEGKGNGIKTVIVNCEDIAKALVRPASYICRFFGLVFGAATNTDSGKYVINGKHEYKDLMTTLDKFIDRFVLCKKCKNPETYMTIKDKNLSLNCKACGEVTTVPSKEKLLKFIFLHPPKRIEKKDSEDEDEMNKVEEVKENPCDKRKVIIKLKLSNGETENIEMLGSDFDIKKIIDNGHPGNRLDAMLDGYKKCYNISTKALVKEVFNVVYDADILDNFANMIDYFNLFLGDELYEKGMIAFLEEFNVACAMHNLFDDPKINNILLFLFTNGYVLKSPMMQWYEGGSVQMSPMKQKAREFIDWLENQNDEEEEIVDTEEEEEEEDDDNSD
ncbi:Eukaryotic translation initiation factor [Entamoeba marina]